MGHVLGAALGEMRVGRKAPPHEGRRGGNRLTHYDINLNLSGFSAVAGKTQLLVFSYFLFAVSLSRTGPRLTML